MRLPLGSTSQYHLNGEIKRYTALVKLFIEAVYGFLRVSETSKNNLTEFLNFNDRDLLKFSVFLIAKEKDTEGSRWQNILTGLTKNIKCSILIL